MLALKEGGVEEDEEDEEEDEEVSMTILTAQTTAGVLLLYGRSAQCDVFFIASVHYY